MIVDDFVYIGSDNGKLYKLNLHNGSEVWNYTVGTGCAAQFWSSPCVDVENDMVFSHASGVHAVNLTTGERIWHFDTMTREFSSPVVYDGRVYLGSYDNHLYCLPQFDPNGDGVISDTEVIWYYETGEYKNGVRVEGTGGAVSTTVSIHDDVVYGAEQTYFNSGTTYSDYYVFALPADDPNSNGVIEHDEIIWKYKIGEKVPMMETDIPGEGGESFSSPTINVELEQIYIGSRATQDMQESYFYCLDFESDDDGIDNDYDGINGNEGNVNWRVLVDNEVFSSPSIHDGVLFFGSGQYSTSAAGSVYALKESDGSQVWHFPNDRGFLSSPLIADGRVYIGCNDNTLYCLEEEDGEGVWEYTAAEEDANYNAFGSSPSLYEEWLVIGNCNGRVYAFRDEPYGEGDDDDDDDDDGIFGDSGGAASAGIFGILLLVVLGLVLARKARYEKEKKPMDAETVDAGEAEAVKDDAGGNPPDSVPDAQTVEK
jgi:outer membrane protein assembly factor BamB